MPLNQAKGHQKWQNLGFTLDHSAIWCATGSSESFSPKLPSSLSTCPICSIDQSMSIPDSHSQYLFTLQHVPAETNLSGTGPLAHEADQILWRALRTALVPGPFTTLVRHTAIWLAFPFRAPICHRAGETKSVFESVGNALKILPPKGNEQNCLAWVMGMRRYAWGSPSRKGTKCSTAISHETHKWYGWNGQVGAFGL